MSVWTENIIAQFHQKILSGCLKICKIRQGITFFAAPCTLKNAENVSLIDPWLPYINDLTLHISCELGLLLSVSVRHLQFVGI